jgi:hypothetical protein
MNVKNGYGAVHHLVDETRRLLCGHREERFDWQESGTVEAVTCSTCIRMLADDERRAGPRSHDSED